MKEDRIAVLVPCHNEELTVGKVIDDFRGVLPDADIYVYDNNSTDKTSEVARAHGARVVFYAQQGKGNTIRTMFQNIDADVYLLVDGDSTYPATSAPEMIQLIQSGHADMVVGNRLSNGSYQRENKRGFHLFGNQFVARLINTLYSSHLNDVMSGYRCFNRTFVKNIAILSAGFSVETEMTLHALDKRFVVAEIPIVYQDRPEGSVSKLNTFQDGLRVLATIFMVFKDYKPLVFFSGLAGLFFLLGLLTGLPVLLEFIKTGYILHVPLAILASSICLLSFILLICGFILDTVVRLHRELYQLYILRNIETARKLKQEPPA